MKFEKGNSFWKSRSKHGRDKLFSTPQALLDAACEYFDYCDNNPWESIKKVESSAGITTENKPIHKPYTRAGFIHFVGASPNWLKEFKKHCGEDFLAVIDEIENFIDNQQWEGAAVGVFNANIIARTLGLKDKSDITSNDNEITVQPPLSFNDVKKKLKEIDGEI